MRTGVRYNKSEYLLIPVLIAYLICIHNQTIPLWLQTYCCCWRWRCWNAPVMILLSKLPKISRSCPSSSQVASTPQGRGSAPPASVTTCLLVWKDCQIIVTAKELILPCTGRSFAPCKAIGCTADFGTFSPIAGLGKPKSNEERLAMRGDGKRAGSWSQSDGLGLRSDSTEGSKQFCPSGPNFWGRVIALVQSVLNEHFGAQFFFLGCDMVPFSSFTEVRWVDFFSSSQDIWVCFLPLTMAFLWHSLIWSGGIIIYTGPCTKHRHSAFFLWWWLANPIHMESDKIALVCLLHLAMVESPKM